MSFLEEMLLRKKHLKSTSTVVRYPDGSVTKLHNDGLVECLPAQPYGYIVDTAPDNVPACIVPDWLFLGSQDCVDNEVFDVHRITHCLSIGIEAPTQINGVEHKFVSCLDLPETDLLTVLDESGAFLDAVSLRQGSAVLVHCNAGVSRSASVVVGYLMRRKGMSFEDALQMVKEKRTCCRPNDGFMRQLRRIGDCL